MKKIPYGISDLKLIKSEGYYYIDKTSYILELEKESPFLLFLRPRRFGKSLLIAMLEAYYDVYYKPDFQTIFADTFIYKNKTKEASSYHILRFDFSAIDITDVENNLQAYLHLVLNRFILRYTLDIRYKESASPSEKLNEIFDYFRAHKNLNLYILIDEYDNFANKLLLLNKNSYESIVTDKTASYKQFFTSLKAGATGNDAPIKRMFITGVTPMTMYDVTSGFNIGKNISLNETFSNLVGVDEEELTLMLEHFNLHLESKTKTLLKEWYNNYRFSPKNNKRVYNTDMILYFLDYYIKYHEAPDELIDINVRSDYSKLRSIIYTNKKLNGNFTTLNTLIGGNSVSTVNLVQDFSALSLEKEENFKSLMFYLGLVTIKEARLDISLQIPNETVKRIDIDFLKDTLELENVFDLNTEKLAQHLKAFALEGDVAVFNYLASEIKRNTSIRDYIYNEQTIKSMYLAYLSLTPYYVINSEAELNKGFADLLIKPLNPYVEYIGLVEFKYIKRSEKVTPSKVETLIKEAKEQLETYAKDELVTAFTSEGLHLQKVVLVFHGWELVQCKAL